MANCCQHTAYLRASGADNDAHFAALRAHSLRALYPLLANATPTYVLDAGAGAGFSTQLLKLALPNSVLVALEPARAQVEALELNTRE